MADVIQYQIICGSVSGEFSHQRRHIDVGLFIMIGGTGIETLMKLRHIPGRRFRVSSVDALCLCHFRPGRFLPKERLKSFPFHGLFSSKSVSGGLTTLLNTSDETFTFTTGLMDRVIAVLEMTRIDE
jgi:hypothetical protein